jgi:uncharacterized lipoprotein YddW (UPF0748 family)
MVLGFGGFLIQNLASAELPAAAVIDDCRYADNAAAQANWKPMQGSASALAATMEGRQVLRLPCRFADTKVERASWDRNVELNLADARGFELKFFCRDASPVSYFSIYFQSGEGWYHFTFFPETSGDWNTIAFDKANVTVEGRPAGWGRISTIRISAWRAKDVDTEFLLGGIRKIGVLGVDALVAVLRGDEAAQRSPGQARSLRQAAEVVAQNLHAAGIGCSVISDLEFTDEHLKQARLVVLPRNPVLPARVEAALIQYLQGGGKVLVFEAAPEKLLAALKLGQDKLVNAPSSEQLLALAAALSPEVGRQAAEAGIAGIGNIASFKNYEDAIQHIRVLARDNPPAVKALASAGGLRESAVKMFAQQDFAGASTQAAAARAQLTEAFCLAQRPLVGEFRAFWCHSAFGVKGMDWDEAIRRLAKNGFTAILPNMLWGGVAYYESKLLPVAPQVAEQGDQLRQCLAACRKYGIEVHVWKVNWYLGSAAPKEFHTRMRNENRLQMSSRGQEKNWLCPSHPENQKLEIDSMLELVRNYDVDGVHFDYIRYPDNDHCFCAGCRERFERACGKEIKPWPQAVLNEGSLRPQWLNWRRDNITAVVKAVSEQARALKPKVNISAAVFPNLPADRDSIGQDWKLWCERGYLDFVCPMDYSPVNYRFDNLVARQLPWAGKTPCYPGIGLSTSRFGADRLIEQINITRRHRTGGFVIFNYSVPESREVLPRLGLGITAKR